MQRIGDAQRVHQAVGVGELGVHVFTVHGNDDVDGATVGLSLGGAMANAVVVVKSAGITIEDMGNLVSCGKRKFFVVSPGAVDEDGVAVAICKAGSLGTEVHGLPSNAVVKCVVEDSR